MKNLSQALSILFHPLWMPLLGTFLLLNYTEYFALYSKDAHRVIYVIVATSTLGLPLMMLPIYLYRKKIKSLELNERSERIIPLLIMTIFYYFSFHTLSNLNAPVLLREFILGVFFSTLVATIVTVKTKISLHSIGLGGVTALLVFIPLYESGNTEILLMQAILISGFVFSARMFLQKHTLSEMLFGYFLGFLTMMLTMVLF
ncbi:MAG TPA: hypothetical protein PK990_01045 [Salinivirgaceae bacterium]|nr:hypothetical protein [Salinivirgaceae bacterium]